MPTKTTKQNLYLIPGFGETTRKKAYREITDFSQKNNFKVIAVNPDWENSTASDWIKFFLDKVSKNQPSNKDSIVVGFSFGAYIAAIASEKIKFKKIILASLSPYFKKDLKYLPAIAHKILGKKRIDDFKKYDFPKKTTAPVLFLVGDKDMPLVIKSIHQSYKKWQGIKKIIVIKNAEHDLNNKLYLDSIKENLKSSSL